MQNNLNRILLYSIGTAMDLYSPNAEVRTEVREIEENILLQMIRELSSENGKLSISTRDKVNKIIADCDLENYVSLHKTNTVDDSTSTLLGLMKKTATQLTYDEQIELNQAVIQQIQNKLPALTAELNKLTNGKFAALVGKTGGLSYQDSKKQQIRDLRESIDDKLNTLKEQEGEKVDLMMEWLNHKMKDMVGFSADSVELYAVKNKILVLKSKILHLQILQGIFTETNQSIKAYETVHKDLKDSVAQSELRIKEYKRIISGDRT